MNEFSGAKSNAKGPNLHKLVALVEVLKTTEPSLRRESHIRRRYQQHASDFDVSLSFYTLLGLIRIEDGLLKPVDTFEKFINDSGEINIAEFKNLLTNRILSENQDSESLTEFLSLFKKVGGDLVLQLTMDERLKYSDLRNLFVELGMIQYLSSEDVYKVQPVLAAQFHEAKKRAKRQAINDAQFSKILESMQFIGSIAELEAIKYESNRLKDYPDLVSKIEHTAKTDVGAGYDILSFEGKDELYRHIEVKAVPMSNYRFYWTSNEINVAAQLKDRYFLYLIPVAAKDKLDIESIEIVQDPYQQIFVDKKYWTMKEKVYTIWKSGNK